MNSTTPVILIVILILQLCFEKCLALTSITPKTLFTRIKKYTSTAIVSLSFLISPIQPGMCADESILALTLKSIQDSQVTLQKTTLEQSESELLTREILYPEGKLIARGMVALTPKLNNVDFDLKNFPLGLLTASDIDSQLGEDDSKLFLLAVGREGPPLAAKSIGIKDLKFPIAFEITTDDLIFPYTIEAWQRSPNSKDTVAVTAILSTDALLSTPSTAEYVGFALSNPVTVAGAYGRSAAKISMTTKISNDLYTPEEVSVLTTVDQELEKLKLSSATKPSI